MTINGRELFVVKYAPEENWAANLPASNWLCVLVDHDSPQRCSDEVIAKIIGNNVCCVCTLGQNCEDLHDRIDEAIAYREADIEQLHLPDHAIMTTWHTDPEEGIWFALFAARHEEVVIDTIVLLDMTNDGTLDGIWPLLTEWAGS